MRLYLDSNVFIAYVRSEIDGAFNLRFQESGDFFSWCREQEVSIVISAHFLEEIEKIIGIKPKAIRETFQFLGLACEYVSDVEYFAMQQKCVQKHEFMPQMHGMLPMHSIIDAMQLLPST